MRAMFKLPLTLCGGLLALVSAGAAWAQPSENATVTVDFSKSRGAYLHPERFNNVSRARTFPEQRDADVEFFNANGLHGDTYKVWVDAHLILDPKTGAYNYDGITDYLTDISRLSDKLLVVMDTRVMVRDAAATPAQVKPVIKTIMRDLKQRFPQIVYIEVFNEPDHNLVKVVKPGDLYAFYKVYYEAVNELNRELKPKVPLQVGGPGFMQYSEEWTNAFLDDFKADPSRGKRIDFFSWHGYGRFPEGTGATSGPRAYHFYKFDPSEVASERGKFEAALAKRGLNTKIPAYITETGIYPGPSFDNQKDPHADALTGAAGIAAIHYWYMESPLVRPFNWVLRHFAEERKDQFVTRVGAGNPIPTNVLTPYGNSMVMQAKLKSERVAATSSALVKGQGVYAIATKDRTGAAVMVWNYQHTNTKSFKVTVDLGKLPASLKGKSLRQTRYRIDSALSNYWTDPSKARLQVVSEAVIRPGSKLSLEVELTPNAFELVELAPASPGRRK